MKLTDQKISSKIFLIRGSKVILDSHLSELYQVPTKRINEQVKRNRSRFPEDFMFQLNQDEWENLRSQFATANVQKRRTLPYVFSEHGVLMLSSVLNSQRAIDVNIHIMRVYTKLRNNLLIQKDVLLKLEKLSKHVSSHDEQIKSLFSFLKKFVQQETNPRTRIGFRP